MDCMEIRNIFIDYLEGSLSEKERLEFEEHMKDCEECREELEDFKEITSNLEDGLDNISAPDDFMDNVKQKLNISKGSIKSRGKRQYKKVFLIAAVVTLLVVSVFAADNFENILLWWQNLSIKQSESIDKLIENGYGQYLNLSQESNGVRVTVEGVVADDINTVVVLKLEDLNKEKKYIPKYSDIEVQGDFNLGEYPANPLASCLGLYSEEPYVGKYILGLAPINERGGTLELRLSQLTHSAVTQADQRNVDTVLTGNWDFTIPVTKYESKTYNINKEMNFDKNLFKVDSIKVGPTSTVLNYSYKRKLGSSIEYLSDIRLISNGKEYRPRVLGTLISVDTGDGWRHENLQFDSMYFDAPKDVQVRIAGYGTMISNPSEFEIDIKKPFPQSYEYMGSDIIIQSVDVGDNSTNLKMTEALDNRKYERLDYEILGQDDKHFSGAGSEDGVVIDKHGNSADAQTYWLNPERYNMYEPRIYTTEVNWLFKPGRPKESGSCIPAKLKIYGYLKTVYTHDSLKFKLDNEE